MLMNLGKSLLKQGKSLAQVRSLATALPSSSSSSSSSSSNQTAGKLELKCGEVFEGKSFGSEKEGGGSGELVFSTGLVGYPESMTDPSYRGQVLVFTQPLIGNYGVPSSVRDHFGLLKNFESERIQVSGIIVSNYSAQYSHWEAVESLGEWCSRNNIPALCDIDTRALTKHLRTQGSSLGRILLSSSSSSSSSSSFSNLPFVDPNERNLVEEVSTKTKQIFNQGGDFSIGLIDCGVKNNIIRNLTKRGAEVHLLPHNFDLTSEDFDGIFISNGPGNPEKCKETIENLRNFINQPDIPPVFGICMGNLLLARAAGANTYKLKHGNRGHNQPALNLLTGKGVITSQNHGYAVCTETLPSGWKPFFQNVNDFSNEGLIHLTKPISSVQFHPEYMGGPRDSEFLFDDFVELVRSWKQNSSLAVAAA